MSLGNKLLELRKANNLSQEELAEKLEVSRQTISKWELNKSSPDIKQAKEISKIFNISLDELVDNDIKDILTKKISNTEKLADLTIKILKLFGIVMIITFIIFILYIILFKSTYAWFIGATIPLNCTLDGKTYSYEVTYGTEEINPEKNSKNIKLGYGRNQDKILKLEKMEGSSYLGGIIDIEKYEYYYQFEEAVFGYFEKNGGHCETTNW